MRRACTIIDVIVFLSISIFIVSIIIVIFAKFMINDNKNERQNGYEVTHITINGHGFLELSKNGKIYIVHDPDCSNCNPQQIEVENKD